MMLSRNFSKKELECKCGCGMLPRAELIERLQILRDLVNRPIHITSGARCFSYNKKIGGSLKSQHVEGTAVDISVNTGQERLELLDYALSLQFTGIGIAKTFLHLDIREKEKATTWLY